MRAEDNPRRIQYARILGLYHENRVSEAIEQTHALLYMANEAGDHYYYAEGINFLGVMHVALGNIARGTDYYFDALLYARRYHLREALAATCNNIGSRYLDTHAYAKAIDYLEQAEKYYIGMVSSERLTADALTRRKIVNLINLALVNICLKHYAKSNTYLDRADVLMNAAAGQDMNFACAFMRCQNQYHLGDSAYVEQHIEGLLQTVANMTSLYNYEQNIMEMFEFLRTELKDRARTQRLLDIVERFTEARPESYFGLVALKMRVAYEKSMGTPERWRESSCRLAEMFLRKEQETEREREQFMNFRMEIKQQEQQRRAAEERLSAMIQTVVNQEYEYIAYLDVPGGLFLMKPSGRLRETQCFADVKGYDQLTQRIVESCVPEARLALAHALTLENVRSQLLQSAEYTLTVKQTARGGVVYKKLSFTFIDTNSGAILLAQMDVTALLAEQQAQEQRLSQALVEAERANLAKSEFLSKMSHEIRTPLNAVIGYISMAQENLSDPEKLADYHAKAQVAARHLLSIINDVLDISAIASGHFKVESVPFDFRGIVRDIHAIFGQQTAEKGICFTIRMPPPACEQLVGDAMRVKQILLNLLSNAVKFTPRGGSITLDIVQTETESTDGRTLRMTFRVQDSGIGMTPAFIERMFQPFEQQDASISRRYGGTGLGLSISKQLCERMGGSIAAESEENVGTTFTVCLPFAAADGAEEKTQADAARLKGQRALVVCADEAERGVLKALLKPLHIRADAVADEAAALRQFAVRRGGSYEYTLCLAAPQAAAAVSSVRALRDAAGDGVRILVLTPRADAALLTAVKEAGADALLEKPVFRSDIAELLLHGAVYETECDDARPTRDFAGLSVLLVEDNPMNMEIAEDILTRVHFRVDKAENGRLACEKLWNSAPGTFRVILMDVQMPEMDGYEATRVIRKSSHPDARTIPILALTANAFAEDVQRVLDAGMNGHVAKPIRKKELFAALERILPEK